jgi:hypothetical protein
MSETGNNLSEENKDQLENEEAGGDRKQVSAKDIRYAAYFVLVIAAIFVTNAMETGSYRTPWPVAAVVSIVGLGLLVYSFVKAAKEDRPEG